MKPLQILTIEKPEEEKTLHTKSEDVQVQDITTSEFNSFLDQLTGRRSRLPTWFGIFLLERISAKHVAKTDGLLLKTW